MTQLQQALKQGLTRLNSHEPQFPPDTYFIRRNQKHLTQLLKDATVYTSKATPELLKRYKLFQLTEFDLKKLQCAEPPKTRPISRHDSYLGRRYNHYTPLHT
jgi:hypothetical protein